VTSRVVQWTTGNVGKQSVAAIAAHPDLELIGCFAWSPDKAGRDVGELCGLAPIGVAATNDVDALLALKPDCVVYNPLWIDAARHGRLWSPWTASICVSKSGYDVKESMARFWNRSSAAALTTARLCSWSVGGIGPNTRRKSSKRLTSPSPSLGQDRLPTIPHELRPTMP